MIEGVKRLLLTKDGVFFTVAHMYDAWNVKKSKYSWSMKECNFFPHRKNAGRRVMTHIYRLCSRVREALRRVQATAYAVGMDKQQS
jgi:hypothetical protein